jgi:sulfotransferase family protein
MKSATSTLYHWLAQQPEVFMASPKETNFFAVDDLWAKGLGWYVEQFRAGEDVPILGEASVMYTSPEHGDAAAERIAVTIPEAKLIYIIREPIERIRSHYRHEVQRHRETRSLSDSVTEPDNPYIGNSLYFRRLAPYAERFPRDQILVLRFEDVVASPHDGWLAALRMLDLPERDAPGTAHNVTRDKTQWTKSMLWLRQRGLFDFRRVAKLPAPARKLGKKILTRGGRSFERKLDESRAPIPSGVLEPVWEDLARLEEWLGLEAPLWNRPAQRPSFDRAP